MSFSGKKTPLQLNVEAQITQKQGFRINPVAQAYQGNWVAATPYSTPITSTYSQGTLTSTTVLNALTNALPNLYTMATSTVVTPGGPTLSVKVWRNAIRIGRPIDINYTAINCPGLGNCKPDTFKTSYAGFGSFDQTKVTDIFYNKTTSSAVGLVEPIYPPYKYPREGTYSYVYKNWSSLTPPAGITEPYQYFNEYAWVTGWPGVNAWQSKTPGNPQVAYDPVADGDSYAAAYFPRPDLVGSQPWRSRDINKIEYDEYFKHGFVATLARQAYYEFWTDYTTRRSNQYIEFVKSIQQHSTFQTVTNQKISTYENSKTFLKGTYSNINDITTSDISGVNLAFKDFGNDFIRLGKSLDLADIHVFGLPSKFVLNLQKFNALTEALKLALLYSDLSIIELEKILLPTFTPSIDQEKKIFNALLLIKGQDLTDITTIINCTTENLETLADLLDPKKMFPTSYISLTVPQYSINNLSSKIYDFIYTGGGVNTRIKNWGTYLIGILPNDLAIACGAFMMTMNQIKNIRQMNVEKFSQVVSNLEVVNKDLPLTNSVSGIPGNLELANQEIELISLGSGSAGTYLYSDFKGAMSGLPYIDFYKVAQDLIKQLQTDYLAAVYKKLYQKSLNNKWALVNRGKGWPNPTINTTGINPMYSYDLFFAGGGSTGATTVTVNAKTTSLPINVLNLYTASGRSARVPDMSGGYSAGDIWGENPNSYTTGQLISFLSTESGTPALNNTYVVLSVGANSVTFQSIIDPIANPAYQPNPMLPNYDPRQYIAPPVTGWPGLSISVSSSFYAYIWELEYDGYPGNGVVSGTVQDIIDAANLEILRIQGINQPGCNQLNYWWDKIGTQMWIEQRAIPLSIPQNVSIYSSVGLDDIDSFTKSIETYALENEPNNTAKVLEAISNTNTIGGQSLVAAMREARNAKKIINTGGELDNDVQDILNINTGTATAVVNGGSLSAISITSRGSGYDQGNPPNVTILPQTGVFGTCRHLETAMNISTDCTFKAIIADYPDIVNVKVGWTTIYGAVTSAAINGPNYEITVANQCFELDVVHTFISPIITPGAGATATAEVDATGAISNINLTNPGSGYVCSPIVIIDPPPGPTRIGGNDTPGNFSGSPYTGNDPVPEDIVTKPGDPAIYTPSEAVQQVIICNCDCWAE